ncbi:MAG: hypothetical protein ACI4KM_05000 [Oscillospiraceae bacterium]
MRKIRIFAALLLTLSLCGCADMTELGDRAIIQAAAIDCTGGVYRVSALMFSGGGSGERIDSSQDNVIKISGEGETVSAAIEDISLIDGKRVYMSEAKLLVFGAGFERADVISALNTLYYDHRCSLNMPVCCAEKAELLTDIRFTEGITAAEKPVSMIENAYRAGASPKTTVFDILCDNAAGRSSLIPMFCKSNNGYGMSDDDNGETAVLCGSALIRRGKIGGYADPKQTVGLMLLSGETERLPLNVSLYGAESACEAYGIKAELSEDGVNFSAQFRRLNGAPLDERLSSAAGSMLGDYLAAALESGLYGQ